MMQNASVLQMRLAPQRRAILRQFCELATAACHFSTSELPKVLRRWCVLHILTRKCASRYIGVPFFDIRTSNAGTFHVFNILTRKCASRYSGVPFFDVRTSKSTPSLMRFAHFDSQMCISLQVASHCSTSELPKVLRRWCILTCKCASRHSGVPCLDIRTSKSTLSLMCFAHFDLQMCFAPQRRAMFGHPNFQKSSGPTPSVF